MTLHTELLVLCDYASISKENKLSINGIFDELRVMQFPGGIARAFLVATVHGDAGKSYNVTMQLEDEKGKKLGNPLQLSIQTSQNGKSNLVMELVNVGFEREGDYYFKLFNKDKEVGSVKLVVMGVSPARPTERIIN